MDEQKVVNGLKVGGVDDDGDDGEHTNADDDG